MDHWITVVVLKIFSPKKKLNLAILSIIALIFRKIANFFCRKLVKLAALTLTPGHSYVHNKRFRWSDSRCGSAVK
jgi:hypothetical protein